MSEGESHYPLASKEGNKSLLLKVLGYTLGAILVLKFADIVAGIGLPKPPEITTK